jgi:hypothetical protein
MSVTACVLAATGSGAVQVGWPIVPRLDPASEIERIYAARTPGRRVDL